MSRHLSNQDINGYIHHTLNDATRETMDRHLDECPVCRERVSVHERQQNLIFQDISAELRHMRTPESMSFTAIRSGLNRSRRLAVVRYFSGKVLTGVGVVMAAAMVMFALTFAFQFFNATPAASSPEQKVMASTLFPNDWNEPSLYQGGLVSSEASALTQIRDASVYHLDLHFNTDLSKIKAQQEVRYVNSTGRSLGALYFRLLPGMDAESIEIEKVAVNGRSVKPIRETATTMRIPLSQLLLPHEQVVVQLDFTIQTNVAEHESVMLSHFVPTLAVFEGEEWRLGRPVHDIDAVPENSFYLYTVTAPRDLAVITSGSLTNQTLDWLDYQFQDKYTFAAGPINQLFIAAGSDLVEVESTSIGSTRLMGYVMSETQRPLAKTILSHTEAALETYNLLFGNYPFTELKVIITDSPEMANTFLPGILIFSDELADDDEAEVAYQVASSLAAQWFARMVGHNTLTEPWLAYGPSQYAAQYYLAETDLMTERDVEAYWAEKAAASGLQNPLIGLDAHKFSTSSYQRTMTGEAPLFMADLAHAMGESSMRQFLQTYYQTFQWQSPTAVSFQEMAEDICDCSLSSLFEAKIYGKQMKPDKPVSYD
jgi:hypothetical protein